MPGKKKNFSKKRRGLKKTFGKPKRRNTVKKLADQSPYTYKFLGNQPFREFQYKKLTYSGTHTLTVGTSGLFGSIQKYKLNSLYDTDETGGGHQPAGYDIMTQIYNRYKVNGIKVTLKCFDPDGLDMIAVGWMLTNPSNASASIANATFDDISEKQQAGTLVVSATGEQSKTRSFYLPIDKIAGITRLQFKADPDNFTGGASSDPGNLVKIQFAAADPRGGSTGTIKAQITLEYYCMFYNRIALTQS